MDQFTHSSSYLNTFNPLVMSNYERFATIVCGVVLLLTLVRDLWVARRKSG